jgi:hypothetical protein
MYTWHHLILYQSLSSFVALPRKLVIYTNFTVLPICNKRQNSQFFAALSCLHHTSYTRCTKIVSYYSKPHSSFAALPCIQVFLKPFLCGVTIHALSYMHAKRLWQLRCSCANHVDIWSRKLCHKLFTVQYRHPCGSLYHLLVSMSLSLWPRVSCSCIAYNLFGCPNTITCTIHHLPCCCIAAAPTKWAIETRGCTIVACVNMPIPFPTREHQPCGHVYHLEHQLVASLGTAPTIWAGARSVGQQWAIETGGCTILACVNMPIPFATKQHQPCEHVYHLEHQLVASVGAAPTIWPGAKSAGQQWGTVFNHIAYHIEREPSMSPFKPFVIFC